MATNLIAYTTITIEAADGTEVSIWAEAEKTSLLPGESTYIYVFTDPVDYLYQVQGDVTEGSLVKYGVETLFMDNEDVTLTKQSIDVQAQGSLKYTPTSSVSVSPITVLGQYSGVTVSGKDLIANSLSTYAAVVRCSYQYKAMKFKYTAPLSPKASEVICMWRIDG